MSCQNPTELSETNRKLTAKLMPSRTRVGGIGVFSWRSCHAVAADIRHNLTYNRFVDMHRTTASIVGRRAASSVALTEGSS